MKRSKSSFIKFLIASFFVMNVFGLTLFASPAKAQFGGVVTDPGLYARLAAQESKQTILSSITSAAMGALMNSLSFMVRKVAYDTATAIATGDTGLNPLAITKSVAQSAADAAGDTAGELIGSLGEPFGLNLCQIPDPNFYINLKLGLSDLFLTSGAAGPRPKCEWQEIKDNFSIAALEERYGEGGSRFASEIFSGSLSIEQSSFGVALESIAQIDAASRRASVSADIERIANQGFKDVVSPVSGHIVTPAAQIRKEAESLSAAEQQKLTATQVAGIYGSELKSLPLMAANIFINTLSQQLLQRVMTGLLPDNGTAGGGSFGSTGPAGGIASFFASSLQDNRKAAQRAFSFLTAPSISQVDNYDIVGDLVTNRIIDSGLEQAINRGKSSGGVYLTIAEAIDQNLLHGNWQLIPPTHSLNASEARDCYIKAYCYSNIQKLRKARVLPVGFELAALKSNPDRPWNLSEVVDGFDQCDENGEPSGAFPYCHLIDPNWIIKVPQTRCGTEGYGPNLVDSATPFRQTECMDLQTCISESSDGTCLAWGYCTKEKNIWRLDGEECPAEYSTCTTYTNTATGQNSSYLARTIDFGQCTAESVGCQGYSTEKVGDEWVTYTDINSVGSLKAAGRPGSIYFNRNVDTCPSTSEGCTAFYGVQRNFNTGLFTLKNGEYIRNTAELIYLKKAPDYLGCYDTDTTAGSETIINWPQTEAEVLNMNVPAECSNFAQVCAPSEAGCSLYTSSKNGDTVSAIVKEQNGCPAECSGYETFKQRASSFEDEQFPLHFIPSLGTICSAQYVGCDEFTNIEESAEGGENLEYYNYIRYCEKPGVVAEKTFFSWEGSHSEGFVLRNHRLKAMDAAEAAYVAGLGLDYDYDNNGGDDGSAAVDFAEGAPAYSDNTENALQNNFDLCNRTNYALGVVNIFDPAAATADCRQFYDNEGNEYYRVMESTVVISDQCRRLRKSDPRLFVDDNITDGATCSNQANGAWGDSDGDGFSECNRCYAGGQVDGNTCVYQALPSESGRCTAAANGCRAYTGNTGNNLRQNIIADGFENTTSTPDWALLPPSGSNILVSEESLQRGQNSLRVSNDDGDSEEFLIRYIRVGTQDDGVSLQTNGWYELSFWARGAPQDMEIRFMQDRNSDGNFEYSMVDPNTSETYGLFTHEVLDATAISPISIGNSWREYTLGPVQFIGNSLTEAAISFHSSGNEGAYFIDNIRLSQIEDSVYLVKDSWKQQVPFDVNGNGLVEEGEFGLSDAPATCFATNENPTGLLPGFALGCSEYTDERNNSYYLTGFTSLCREEAVGCQPLFDTNNTLTGADARLPKVYNAVCSFADSSSGVNCSVNYFGQTGTCFIPQGEESCYIPSLALPLDDAGTPDDFTDDIYRDLSDLLAYNFGGIDLNIDLSSVYVPAESGAPIFLTNRAEYNCPSGDLGCMLAGLQDQILPSTSTVSYEYSDVYIKNNPETYNQTLCRQDLIGCGEFAAGADTYYFRDPADTGNSICTYRENVNGFDGWYLQGVGRCESDPGSYCRADSDCAANDCTDFGSVPCYEDYLKDEIYSLWSNDSADYAGFVGSCPNKYNACTELVDPADTSSADLNGKAYYRIFNEQLNSRVGECNGQVSLKDGCVLFDKTDQPNKFYSSELTYMASDATVPPFGFVNPVASTDPIFENDTNILLKVNRDRECSEWLSCSNKIVVRNEKGDKQVLCSKYKACEKLKKNGRDDECLRFVTAEYGETFLDEDKYTMRDMSWYGEDYSGYSLLNKHQILTYGYFSFPDEPTRQFLGALLPNPSYIPNVCSENLGDTNGNPCGPGLLGRCFGGRCVNAIDNTAFETVDTSSLSDPDEIAQVISDSIKKGLLSASCKIFSEEDSPFPYGNIAADPVEEIQAQFSSASRIKRNLDTSNNDIVPGKFRIEHSISNSFFGNVNLCQGEEDCSCEYNKYDYGNFIDYYIVTSTESVAASIPIGVCTGGEKDGEPCEDNSHCVVRDENTAEIISSGQCSRLKEVQTRYGVRGFCLEPDLSRPINGKANFASEQEYACQTWLPIQTSASNIDLFNMNVAAGYLPSVDAPNSSVAGDLMCTGVHRGGFKEQSVGDGLLLPFVSHSVGWVHPPDPPGNGTGCSSDPGDAACRDYDMTILDNSEDEFSASNMNDIFGGTYFNHCDPINNLSPSISNLNYNLLPSNLSLDVLAGASGSPYYHMICDDGPLPSGITNNSNGLDFRRGLYNTTKDSFDANMADNSYAETHENYTVGSEVVENWKKTMYKVIKGFAWNQIGNNTLLLRAEIHPNKDWVPNFAVAGDPVATDSANYTARFAPWVGFGVDTSIESSSPEFMNFERNRGVFERWYHPATMGGFDPTEINGYGNLVNLDDAPDYINEDNLGTMYFVPLMYKGGLNGYVPKTINEIDEASDMIKLPIKDLKNSTSGWSSESLTSYDHDRGVYSAMHLTESNPQENATALVNWTYRATLGDNPHLFYNDDRPEPAEVVTKYVSVFFVQDGITYRQGAAGTLTTAPSFVDSLNLNDLGVPADDDHDPFQVDCEQGYESAFSHYNPWWAVAANFGSSGEFLGYTTKWCTGSYSATGTGSPPDYDGFARYGGGISFAVVAELANQCFEISKVNKSFLTGIADTLNKAWTNRVWLGANDGTPVPYSNYDTFLEKGQAQTPFGSMNLSGDYLYEGAPAGVIRNLSNFSFIDPDTDGIPYACSVTGGSGYIFRFALNFNDIDGRECPFNIYSDYRDGATEDILENLADQSNIKTVVQGRNAISRLFAMQFTRAQLNNTGSYDITEISDDRSDAFYGEINVPNNGNTKTEYLLPPSVVSLNPAFCLEGEDGGVQAGCTAGDFDNISVNGRTGVTKDYNFENGVEIEEVDQRRSLVGIEAFTADVKFFAYADDNRMPIRRVSVNWGDGLITNENSNGFYKNSKPICAPAEGEMVGLCEAGFGNNLIPSGLTCQNNDEHCPVELKTSFHQTGSGDPSTPPNETPNCLSENDLLNSSLYQDTFFDEPRFGNQPRACSTNPFEFEHPYTCEASMTEVHVQFSNLPADVRDSVQNEVDQYNFSVDASEQITLEGDYEVCVFKPRVQVVDNWGYCNGECPGGAAGAYCYNRDIDNPSANDECVWDPPSGNTPYTEYKGEIVVVPLTNF